jgi:putative GTP pyrophosphokinase
MSNKTRPKYSKSAISKAGDAIRDRKDLVDLGGNLLPPGSVIENHRASHAYILNTFQANLRGRIKGKSIIFAQRLKRRPTIYDKLRREKGMQLSRMHDIAGCRLIFETIDDLLSFQKKFRQARFGHIRRHSDSKDDPYDYITKPKLSGYRGKHDVYQYVAYAPAGSPWNGLNLEIQYRTKIQHAWATAVEIAGSISENRPKFNQGDERYLDFFRITSEILARYYEGMEGCLAGLNDFELIEQFNQNENEIHLLRSLRNINKSNLNFLHSKNVILIFNEDTGELKTESYVDAPAALQRYFVLENEAGENTDVVLVRADSSDSIKNAFRNYFSDSADFVNLVESALENLGAKDAKR